MRVLFAAFVAGALLSTGTIVRGDIYKFKLEGEVTSSFHPNVEVGDLFMIEYYADSTDLDPSPTTGRFAATQMTVSFPLITLTSAGIDPQVYVGLGYADGTDRVFYLTFGPNYGFVLDFRFPAGSLTSDVLPVSLPLDVATSALFQRYFLGTDLLGQVYAFSGSPIPEPVSLCLFVLLLWVATARCRTPLWKCPSPAASCCSCSVSARAGGGAHGSFMREEI